MNEMEALGGLEHGLLAVELFLAGEVAVALLAGLVVLELLHLLEVEPLVEAALVRILLLQHVSLRKGSLVGIDHLDFLYIGVEILLLHLAPAHHRLLSYHL